MEYTAIVSQPSQLAFYHMATCTSRHDEVKPALQLATKVEKTILSCPLGTTGCVPQEKFPRKSYNKNFIDQACLAKMAEYWPRSFFQVNGPQLNLGPQTHSKRNWLIFSHVDLTLGQ